MSTQIIADVIKSIALSSSIDDIIILRKGTSADKKYILTEKSRRKYIFRLANMKIHNRRKVEFDIICDFYNNGIKCLKPVAFGITPNGVYCYSIFKYVNGRAASQVLPSLSTRDQNKIGITAGKELKKMHQLKCPEPAIDWFEKSSKEFFANLEEFRRLKLKFDREKYVYEYIIANINLMKFRPSTFQHNDYGVGNFIVQDRDFKAVIDFNSFNWGDPICDFFQIPWTSKNCSLPFAKGQIVGYNDGKVTKDFWELYNLYVMQNLYFRLVSIYKKDHSRYNSWLKKVNQIVKEHNLKTNGKPVWFK